MESMDVNLRPKSIIDRVQDTQVRAIFNALDLNLPSGMVGDLLARFPAVGNRYRMWRLNRHAPSHPRVLALMC